MENRLDKIKSVYPKVFEEIRQGELFAFDVEDIEDFEWLIEQAEDKQKINEQMENVIADNKEMQDRINYVIENIGKNCSVDWIIKTLQG